MPTAALLNRMSNNGQSANGQFQLWRRASFLILREWLDWGGKRTECRRYRYVTSQAYKVVKPLRPFTVAVRQSGEKETSALAGGEDILMLCEPSGDFHD